MNNKKSPPKKIVFQGLMSVDRKKALAWHWDTIQQIIQPIVANIGKPPTSKNGKKTQN